MVPHPPPQPTLNAFSLGSKLIERCVSAGNLLTSLGALEVGERIAQRDVRNFEDFPAFFPSRDILASPLAGARPVQLPPQWAGSCE